MKTGAEVLFNDAEFNNIFSKSVHLIGAVNAMEEAFKQNKRDFYDHPSVALRGIALDCLTALEQLTAAFEQTDFKQVDLILDALSTCMHRLQGIQQQDLPILDLEMKQVFLPSLCLSLTKFQHFIASEAYHVDCKNQDIAVAIPSYLPVATSDDHQNPFNVNEPESNHLYLPEPIKYPLLYVYHLVNRNVVSPIQSILPTKKGVDESVEMVEFQWFQKK